MFKFNRDKVHVRYCGLLSISKSTIDPRITVQLDGGEIAKYAVPAAVARSVSGRLNGVSRFADPYPACLVFVDDKLVSVDAAVGPNYQMYQALGEWISPIESRLSIVDVAGNVDWMFDGQYAYISVGDVERFGETNFGTQRYRAINLFKLNDERADLIENLAGVCYYNIITGEWVCTSPVTRHSGKFLQLTGDTDEFNKTDAFVEDEQGLERMNHLMFPNLRFVNYTSQLLSQQFGYDVLEPLGLPLLMIEHRTMNLGGLSLPVQISSHAPFKFLEALAWLVGLHSRVETIDHLIAIKSCVKMLITKGSTLSRGTDSDVDTKQLIQQIRNRVESTPMISLSFEVASE